VLNINEESSLVKNHEKVLRNQEVVFDLIGINGAALATLIVVLLYSIVKISYIKAKLKIQPFQLNTLKVLVLISAVYAGFYFWNFSYHPFVNIGLKSIAIVLIYGFIINRFHISQDISSLVMKYFKRK
jgi:ABC-type xylose transport system permease subunit